ncbi:unnamed protein product [Penicillium olsonii]|nr:unnamed protein product [Penicillium olsonii]
MLDELELIDEVELMDEETAPAETLEPSEPIEKDELTILMERVSDHGEEINELLDELEEMEYEHDIEEVAEILAQRRDHTSESFVHLVRQRFGDGLPDALLSEEELQIYIRLYGAPIGRADIDVMAEEEQDEPSLLRDDGEGGWEEVDMEEEAAKTDDAYAYDMDNPPKDPETLAEQRTREVAEQLGGQEALEQFEDEAVPGPTMRADPNTLAGRFGTDPSTIFLPEKAIINPIAKILSGYANKHLYEVSNRVFGGQGLPHSTATPRGGSELPQKPLPLDASQRYMGQMEANTYLAVLYPGIYSAVLSVLVETRKRLGDDWLRGLLSQKGGPNVLDASGGGAGILAWKDLARTEWDNMYPSARGMATPPGKSTVIVGSDTLRARASQLLDNTTFLPRLPDYTHIRQKPTLEDSSEVPKRKQYDIIIAPYSIQGYTENYERKQHVENLWSLLNPNGGILILLEKGRQRGFEAISGAREMLLQRHIANPGSTEYDNFLEDPDQREVIQKEPGMIIAPCTNHSTCPMHNFSGTSHGRREYCSFEQRYVRPFFLQNILRAKHRNHEDVRFSYLSVQRGVDLRQDRGLQQNPTSTDVAFEGFPTPEDLKQNNQPTVETLALPRTVFPPLKRDGHVLIDVCTPAGKIERWTVSRAQGAQQYRDARKAKLGDLWALGARFRRVRNLELGGKHFEGKKERLERRAAERQLDAEEEGEIEEDEDDFDDPDEDYRARSMPQDVQKKKGQRVPTWKKAHHNKKLRQAYNKRDRD